MDNRNIDKNFDGFVDDILSVEELSDVVGGVEIENGISFADETYESVDS